MDENAELIAKLDRIANLMALTLVRELEQGEQIRTLGAVGYSPAEIAGFLAIKPNTVSAALYRQRQRQSGK